MDRSDDGSCCHEQACHCRSAICHSQQWVTLTKAKECDNFNANQSGKLFKLERLSSFLAIKRYLVTEEHRNHPVKYGDESSDL